MSTEERLGETVSIRVENIGGIDETELEVSRGVTALTDDPVPDSEGPVTDQLLADESVTCWTCGTEVAALLPDDAAALDEDYQRVTDI